MANSMKLEDYASQNEMLLNGRIARRAVWNSFFPFLLPAEGIHKILYFLELTLCNKCL